MAATYTDKTAELYASLGITGTTYQAPFEAFVADVRSLQNLAVLDFGCGSGRSTRLLKTLKPTRLVGVDHNQSMIEQARKISDPTIEFIHIEDAISLPFMPESFDIIFSSSVYCEFSNRKNMSSVTIDLHRLLKTGGSFYMITSNPDCLGADFISYHYDRNPNVRDGDPMTCHVHTNPPFDIADTWWSISTLDSLFQECGFKINKRLLPLASGKNWRDEVHVAPAVIYHLIKPEI